VHVKRDLIPAFDDGAAIAIATGILGRMPDQTGFVTPDVRSAARSCVEAFGMSPWAGFEYGASAFAERTYLGRPGHFTTRSVVWGGGRFSFVEPVTGRGCFADALAARGPSLHHVGYFVDDVGRDRAVLLAAGGEELMTSRGHGLDGDGELVFCSLPGTTCVVELIVRPRRRREPDFWVR
jgi:hypothetical protein